ncbi:MAG TPA: serine/threonine-protein kinase, partial [Polyangiaceae bacterium]
MPAISAPSDSDIRVQLRRAASSVPSSLPADVVHATSERLLFFMYSVAGAEALYTALYWTVWRAYGNVMSRVIGLALMVGSLALAHVLRRSPRAQSVVTRIGIAYEIVVCFAVAIVEFRNTVPQSGPLARISWVCVVIVLFPVLIPARPRVMQAVSFAAAAMMPVGYLAYFLVSGTGQSPMVLGSLFVPPFVCAAISSLLANVMHRMGTEVSKARRLGSYELVERLGEGGMGEVWRARHRLLVRPAAIKLIHPQTLVGADPESARDLRDRFEREAQATALLTSPHTVELFDFGVSENGVFYYVMELLDGIDLESLVRNHGPVSAERAVWLLRQVCDSLDDAHRAGLVHRDIKPANIVATRRGRRCDYVKVLDFGLVKGSVKGEGDPELTDAAKLKGTPAYWAPETATGRGPIDARADIYALGCVAYWLITGALVFDAPTPLAMA